MVVMQNLLLSIQFDSEPNELLELRIWNLVWKH